MTTPTMHTSSAPFVPMAPAASYFRCPRCAGELSGSATEYSCARCAEQYPIRDGIIDFRCGRHDYYFNPVPRPAMQELLSRAPAAAWDDTVRQFLSFVRLVPSWIDNVSVAGRYSWKLFLELPPSARFLDFGCGLGNLTQNLAPHVSEAVALDLTWERLQFAQQRFAKFNAGQRITLVAGGDGPHLPFPDGHFDCIALSGVLEWIPSDASAYRSAPGPVSKALRMLMSFFGDTNPRRTQIRFLRELRRILKPQGQLFVAIENRWSYEYFGQRRDHHSGLMYGSLLPRFAAHLYSLAHKRRPYRTYTHSFAGLGRLFSAAGFPHQQRLGLTPGYSGLEEVIPLAGAPAAWNSQAAARNGGFRRSRYFVPAFGIAGKGVGTPTATLLDRVADEIQAGHPELGRLAFHSCDVTGKEKAVLQGRAGQQAVVLKVPVSAEAYAGERNNVGILERLALHASVADLVPRPLAHGVHQNLPYFLETAIGGAPFGKATPDVDRAAAAHLVAAVLERLWNLGVSRVSIAKGDAVYAKLVSVPIAKLRAAGIDTGQIDRLEERMERLLAAATWPIGVSHGDLSIHNLFFSGHRVTGVIDWADATFDGLPILDALAFAQSLQRRSASERPRPRVGETLKHLATWNWTGEEVGLLQKAYKDLEIDIGLHAPLCELTWLQHMSNQLDSPLRFNRDAVIRKGQAFLDT
jgi:SAM-dependent methyltransferase